MRDITCEHAVLGIPSDFSGMYCLSRPPSVRLTKWAISVPDACNSAPGGGGDRQLHYAVSFAVTQRTFVVFRFRIET